VTSAELGDCRVSLVLRFFVIVMLQLAGVRLSVDRDVQLTLHAFHLKRLVQILVRRCEPRRLSLRICRLRSRLQGVLAWLAARYDVDRELGLSHRNGFFRGTVEQIDGYLGGRFIMG